MRYVEVGKSIQDRPIIKIANGFTITMGDAVLTYRPPLPVPKGLSELGLDFAGKGV